MLSERYQSSTKKYGCWLRVDIGSSTDSTTWLSFPPFGTRGSLTLDIAIASYTINPFYFFTLQVHTRVRGLQSPCPHNPLVYTS